MLIRKHFNDYNFVADTNSGVSLRWGAALGVDAAKAYWPELADISISNYCTKGCEFCYRGSSAEGAIMMLEDYEHVLDSLTNEKFGGIFQVAIGGGEPLEHPQFIDILKATKSRGIIANFTTNGINLTKKYADSIKNLVGAVAVSANKYEDICFDKIKILCDCKIKTNLHFVLDNQSIVDAINILNGVYDEELKNLNSIIFLTFKPRGRAVKEKCLENNSNLFEFLECVDNKKTSINIGFDACFVPLLMKYTQINTDYVDSCECGFFSVYVDEYKNVSPCSFSVGSEFKFNLDEYTMDEIWNEKFEVYRNMINTMKCADLACKNRDNCRGTCIYFSELNFCFV